LLEQGAKAPQITKVSGVGGKEPLATEPDPGSAEEKAMDKAALEAARNKNRRITVNITEHCK
jgi:outer membrane protein OmpA-like peptidoglycan-associated protein